MTHSPPSDLVVLYDGVCSICNRSVQFVLRHDHKQKFRFAALQGAFRRRGIGYGTGAWPPDRYICLRRTPDGNNRLTAKSDAALEIFEGIGRPLVVSQPSFYGSFPDGLRDWAYDLIARNRYRWFGRYDACPMPDREVRNRFMD